MKHRLMLWVMFFATMMGMILSASEKSGYWTRVGKPKCLSDVHVVKQVSMPDEGKAKNKQKQKIRLDDKHQFWMAVNERQLELVQSFLQAGISPDASMHCSEIPLITAIDKKYFEIADVLIDAGAKVNGSNCGGRTPLIAALSNGPYNPNMVNKLIKLGANLNAKETHWGYTPLTLALLARSLDMVEFLLKSGAHVNEKFNDGSTALMMMMNSCDRIDFAQTLIKAGAEINAKDRSGRSALMIAAISGCNKNVQFLLDAGINVNATDNDNNNALAYSKNCEMLNLLLRAGAKINNTDDEGFTPLMLAVRRNNIDIAISLIVNGALLNTHDWLLGRTPLILAAFFKRSEIVQALLKKGASANEEDYEGWTPLHWAVYIGNPFLVHKIKKKSNSISPSEYANQTAYDIRMNEWNRLNIVKLLIMKGADVNAQSHTLGLTPLMLAAVGDNKGVVPLLLQSHANVNVKTRWNELNVMDFARLGGNADIIDLLEKESHFSSLKTVEINDVAISKMKVLLLMEIIRKSSWPINHFEARYNDYNDGNMNRDTANAALHELAQTKEGNLYLLEFIRNHPDASTAWITGSLKIDFIRTKLDRKFWNDITLNLDKHYKTTASWAGQLPYEESIKYKDIWLEWLKIAESSKDKTFTTLPLHESALYFYSEVIKHSVTALCNIYDARIPSAIHPIFDSEIDYNYWSLGDGPAEILYNLGDPESFPRVEKCIKGIEKYFKEGRGGSIPAMANIPDDPKSDADIRKITEKEPRWFNLLLIANDNYALRYAENLNFPSDYFWNKYPAERPDLARGLIRNVLSNSDIIKSIKKNDKIISNEQFASIIMLGSSIMKDAELLEWLKRAEEWKSPAFMNLWIDVMGNRDAVIGNAKLLQIAQQHFNLEHDLQIMVSARNKAARALGKRLLGLQRNDMLKRLMVMPDKERSSLVACIIGAMGIFPGVINECSEGYDPAMMRNRPSTNAKISLHNTIESEPKSALLQKYENVLLDWIIWAPSSVDLSFAYGFMTGKEAQQRFSEYVEHESSSAIQFAWIYRKYPSPDLLKKILPLFQRKEPYESMILFMLSESGDDSAYSMLKQKYYSKALAMQDIELYSLLAEESARRHDYESLRRQIQNVIKQIVAAPASHSNNNYLKIILSKFIGLSISSNAQENLKIIKSINLDTKYFREVVVEACIDSRNTNCEYVLKVLEPAYDSLKTTIRKDNNSGKQWGRWILALKATNSPWSRNKIIQDADYSGPHVFEILADLGERQALTLTITNGITKQNNLLWLDALKLGEVEIAASKKKLQSAMDCINNTLYRHSVYWCINFQNEIKQIDLSTWSSEQIRVAQDKLVYKFHTLPMAIRYALVSQLGSSYKLWSNDLIQQSLNDSYAPVRLAMLQILLYQPRPELNPRVRDIYKNDPIPWCRRLANEILQLHLDPLLPQRGILFKF